MMRIVYIFSFLFGITIGSFLNVLIHRIPLKEKLVADRSRCSYCHTTLQPFDLIPVVSYLFLKGKCRYCGSTISKRYPIIEIMTGFVFMLCLKVFSFQYVTIFYLLIGCLFIVLSFIDIDTLTLPDSLLVFVFLCSIIVSFLQKDISFYQRIIGFFVCSVPMLLLTMIIDGAFGGGDIKLMAVCGYLLGSVNIMLAMFLALLIGGIHASYLLFIKKVEHKQMAFGPSLCLGCFIALLYGNEIIVWYVSLL